jgi:hypothetical protein
MGRVDARLVELGITLPPPPRPIANFLPFILDAGLVYLAGQTNDVGGAPNLTGKVPTDHDAEAGWAAARTCALNLLAVLREALTGCDAPPVLEAAEQALDEVVPMVGPAIVGVGHCTGPARRDHRRGPPFLEPGAQAISIVGSIR